MTRALRGSALSLLALPALVGVLGLLMLTSGRADDGDAAVFITKMPDGYRDWRLISVAHEEGMLNSFSGVLGNDVAIEAYRGQKPSFPDGTVIASLHWQFVRSEQNDKVFGQPQSFVPGAQTNTQFMIKDSKKYAATGGWGFGHFNADGTLGNDTLMKTCFACHQLATHDFVFTQYAP
jgi:cytochrome P460